MRTLMKSFSPPMFCLFENGQPSLILKSKPCFLPQNQSFRMPLTPSLQGLVTHSNLKSVTSFKFTGKAVSPVLFVGLRFPQSNRVSVLPISAEDVKNRLLREIIFSTKNS